MLLRRIAQPFYTAFVVITFVASLLITFPFFFVLGLINNPSSRQVLYRFIKSWSVFWLWLIGMPLKVSGVVPEKKRYIVVANHISYLDTVVLFPSLPAYFRALGKSEIARIPVLGMIYRQLVVMVDRSSAESRTQSMRTMHRVIETECDIMIFPEGTFNETGDVLKSFYNGAFRLAVATQTDILPVVYPDTIHRWHYSAWWKLSPGVNRAIILEPVSVSGKTTDDIPYLKDIVAKKMTEELSKYDYP